MVDHAPKNERTRLYALLQVGRQQLGMDDETYRQFLRQHGASAKAGRISATTMSLWQLTAALEDMKRKGFRPKPKRGTPAAVGGWRAPRIKKITAIWCALADAGVVRDRSEKAMARWCAGVTKVARLDWATSEGLNQCVEGLKQWAARERVRVED